MSVGSYSICLFATGLFRIRIMSSKFIQAVACVIIPPFLRLNNIYHQRCLNATFYLSVKGHLDFFHLLVIMTSVAVTLVSK